MPLRQSVRRKDITTATRSRQAVCTKWLIQHHMSSLRLQPDRACKKKQTNPECDSAIGQHVLKSRQCAANYHEHQFSDTARSRFHLSVLETTYIKIRHPNLCRQKEFVCIINQFK